MLALGNLALTFADVFQSSCLTVRYQASSGASALGCFSQNARRARLAMIRTADYIGPIMGPIINDRK